MKGRILKAIRDCGGKNVTFAEIRGRLDPADMDGHDIIGMDCRHAVVWYASREFRDAFVELATSGAVSVQEVSPFLYYYDGGGIGLPIGTVRRALSRGYKTPHWIPVGVSLRDV